MHIRSKIFKSLKIFPKASTGRKMIEREGKFTAFSLVMVTCFSANSRAFTIDTLDAIDWLRESDKEHLDIPRLYKNDEGVLSFRFVGKRLASGCKCILVQDSGNFLFFL